MMPYFYIFGKAFPMYGLCAVLGLLFGAVLVYFTSRKRRDFSKIYIINIPLVCAVGAFLGAHLVYFLTRLDTLIEAFQHADVAFSSWNNTFAVLGDVFGGMVFYGGLLGAILGAYIYCKIVKIDFSLYADIMAPAIPLFHAFGRLGCTFAGCCYGLESNWGVPVLHTVSDGTTVTHTHLPIPLIEAGCNLVLMVILLLLSKKHLKKGSLLALYFILYPIVRFTDEFYRGDLIRGVYFGLSTSQWISIGVFIIGVIMLMRRYVFKGKEQFGYQVPVGEVPEGYIYNKYAGAISPREQEKQKQKELAAAQKTSAKTPEAADDTTEEASTDEKES